jgi:glycosyltransferase involved in cell wall biosynthesis
VKLGSTELIYKHDYTAPDEQDFPLDLTRPSIAICMATYNPPIELFKRQIQSIREQTFRNWICLISDDCSDEYTRIQIHEILAGDPRFYFSPSQDRLGFYFNFERAFSLIPKQIPYVAPSDQDDYWHPEKLETLLSQMDSETSLVYSDMNIVDKDGKLLQKTYWANRPNRFDNITSLILANTITGAASLFPRALLDTALPFPQQIGDSFHDHWIGCMALATGKVKYIDRPLYDYVQHRGNVLGWYGHDTGEKMGLQGWLKFLRDPVYRARYFNNPVNHFYDYFRIQISPVLIQRWRHIAARNKPSSASSTQINRS